MPSEPVPPAVELELQEPRWPAIVAGLAAVALHFALPDELRLGTPWLLAGVVIALIIAADVSRRFNRPQYNNRIAYAILVILTAGLLVGVWRLVIGLLTHASDPTKILRAAAVLWVTNVIVFAVWYWRLDAGGPNARERRLAHTEGAFLFPQMTFLAPDNDDKTIAEQESWRPHFVDYLFVAFNTSTAFSPTDAPVLTRWAKMAMMIQATISFITVVLIAARSVNILPGG